MATHGTIAAFSSSQETWTVYVERLEQYFAANKIENADQQRAILLSVCGPATYRLIRNLVSPKKPTEFKIDELIDIVRKHHDPKPSAIVQRFHFNSRNRHTGESIAAYVAQLRQLAEHCEYGTTLNDMLRDRLVCGVDDLRIQRRLLAEPQLTFDKAFEIAVASESAEKNVKDLQSGTQLSDSPVNKLRTHHSATQKSCYRCGDKHKAADCRFRTAECRKCGKKGHIARACKGKLVPVKGQPRPQQKAVMSAEFRPTHIVKEEEDDYSMYHVTGTPVKPLLVTVSINNTSVEMEVDTGASVSIISEATYNRLWSPEDAPPLQESSVKLRTYSGEQIGVKGSIRICGDYKVTINQASQADSYPLPRIDDLFASLAGGKKFSKLDLAHAYQQIQLDDVSKKLVAINTHKGLFQYNRLPFGVSAAPSIFQRTMETLLQGLPGVCLYLDDILITGQSDQEHLTNLSAVLQKLAAAGMKLKPTKCFFMLQEVEYLGHKISAKGLEPTQEKVQAIIDAPAPRNVSQLKSFLGMLNYYGKFLPNLSTCLAPLYSLLQKRSHWSWDPKQHKAFEEAKNLLTSSSMLTHYDPSKPLILACDASPYGIGAVLSHKVEDDELPIAFASRSLAPAEKNYSQIDKEALAIVFGVKHFHQYLFGRHFMIKSDHKPLQHLLGERKGIPAMASARVQRWALTLSAYNYTVQYVPGKDNANADVFSRLPLSVQPKEVPMPQELVYLLEGLEISPVTVNQIRTWTDRDPVLAKVRRFVQQGWPRTVDLELQPYHSRQLELSIQDNCLLWGSRIIVPKQGREKLLALLHEGHPGICKCYSASKFNGYWPFFSCGCLR